MATNDRVQLKREEVVGDDVVLTDINPKSNTKSIDDTNSGVSLEKTIERLWNAINNKLSRIVNSVNGRTGVVVLNASDVGLGNVDNVSLADIKNWVIERTIQEFRNKRIELFDSLNEVDDRITEWNNDEAYADKPYYSHHGYDNDKRGYIGYIYIDPGTGRLTHTFDMVIDTVGWTDNSLVYNEDINDKKFSNTGGLGVNIWKYEDALELYNDAAGKAASGLRIDKANIAPRVYFFDGVYGDGTDSDSNALLYIDKDSAPTNPKTVNIIIDGEPIEYAKGATDNVVTTFKEPNIIRQQLKIYDLVICNFRCDKYITNSNSGNVELIDERMNPLLVLREPAIGQVIHAPTKEHPEFNYVIEFFSIKPNIYKGLKEYNTHDTGKMKGKAIGVSLLESKTKMPNGSNVTINVSGLNVFAPYENKFPMIHEVSTKRKMQTIIPTGLSGDVFKDDNSRNNCSGVYILPNFSLCVIPSNDEIRKVDNWPTSGPPYDSFSDPHESSSPTMLGINLIKSLHIHPTEQRVDHVVNVSGLRIDTSSGELNKTWFGSDKSVPSHSGGLSVNVGSFLEIGSFSGNNATRTDENFYDEGKVNVRVDETKSLYNAADNNNKLGVRVKHDGGIIHSDSSGKGSLAVNYGLGLHMSVYDSTGSVNIDTAKKLGVNIVDRWNSADNQTLNNTSSLYGGLRFIPNGRNGSSPLAIRVNACEENIDNVNYPLYNNFQIGSAGIGISGDNIVAIQFYKGYGRPAYDAAHAGDYNPLYIRNIEECIINIAKFNDWGLPAIEDINTVSPNTNTQPTPGIIYFERYPNGSKKYRFYNSNTKSFESAIRFYRSDTGDRNKQVNCLPDPTSSGIDDKFLYVTVFNNKQFTLFKYQKTEKRWDMINYEFKLTPGLSVRYNRDQGIDIAQDGTDTRASTEPALCVRLSVTSGLAFAPGHASRYDFEQDKILDKTVGLHVKTWSENNKKGNGLYIDNDGVLGVRLSNSLKVNDEGKLEIVHESHKNLTISKDVERVTYNGDSAVEIMLGPGLTFEDVNSSASD